MSAKTEKLLSMYRAYEGLVRDSGQDPKDLEQGLEGPLSSEMTMIRQFRNFLSHVDDPGFLEPTDKMLKVLEAQVRDWSMRGDVAKKHAKAAAVLSGTDKCADAVARLAKLKLEKAACAMPDGTYAIYDVYALATAALADRRSKVMSVKPLREKPAFVGPAAPVRSVDLSRVTLCTADGTGSGKLCGMVLV